MKAFPIGRSQYAETHYKFKLPWSPLYRAWPEIFLDGPSLCVPGRKPTFYLAIKDADYFPITIKEVAISLQLSGETKIQNIFLNQKISENLRFIPLNIEFPSSPGRVYINGRISVEKKNGSRQNFLNANFPGLLPDPLILDILSAPLPYPEGWFAGELHCHTNYSSDPVEFGAPLAVLREAGYALGLGFIGCTDHSYDFYYQKERFMDSTDPSAVFREYQGEARALNSISPNPYPTLIPGEEVSCGNSRGENVHLLVLGHSKFLPGLGDGGRRWFNNKPDLKIHEVLERIGTTPCFAAHPRVKVGYLEKLIFRRGMWNQEDVEFSSSNRGIDGLQFWNGHRNSGFEQGKIFWIQQLLAGRKILPIGANDAHGDLNRNIGVKTPLFSLYQSRNHIFGNVRTVVQASDRSEENIQQGFRQGRLVCTDGPFLSLEGSMDGILIRVSSIVDFGALTRVRLFAGKVGEPKETLLHTWNLSGDTCEFMEMYNPTSSQSYFRAEVLTSKNKFALASPLFIA